MPSPSRSCPPVSEFETGFRPKQALLLASGIEYRVPYCALPAPSSLVHSHFHKTPSCLAFASSDTVCVCCPTHCLERPAPSDPFLLTTRVHLPRRRSSIKKSLPRPLETTNFSFELCRHRFAPFPIHHPGLLQGASGKIVRIPSTTG